MRTETDPRWIETNVPLRLDRLPWARWHWLVVAALGITWMLDGLEVTVVGAVASVLESEDALALSSVEVGWAGSSYLAGAILGSLVFGHLTDRFGRKRLFLVTLGLYVLATLLTAASWSFASFALFRFLTGAAIGGEYAAINSAIDELLPARVRGFADIAINGSYWLGTALGASMTIIFLDPRIVPPALGWRLAFALGAVLMFVVAFVRRVVPESPRWLILRGRVHEAHAIVEQVERHVSANGTRALPEVEGTMLIEPGRHLGFREVFSVVFGRYRTRGALGLVLMISQAFFYNAIFFSYSLILTKFFAVKPARVGLFLIPFAVANFAGPLLLGKYFDTRGRRPMIVSTYALSGASLIVVGFLFRQGQLTAITQVLGWSLVFFFGSAAASSAYLTVSELFPIELRAMAIALFYAVGTAVGGLLAPAFFGWLVQSGDPREVFVGYALGGVLMLVAAAFAWRWAVAAEGRSLEQVAAPLSARSLDARER